MASGFYYSDGVAVADDGSYLLVVETDTLRVVKLWLTGDKVIACTVCLRQRNDPPHVTNHTHTHTL